MTYTTNDRPALLLPALAPLYDAAVPLTNLWLRIVCGAALMVHGWPKIQNPMGAADMVAGLGFAPGWFWSILLSATEFFGGFLLLIGLFTRVAAAGTTVILIVATYFHWVVLDQGYSGAELAWLWAAITLTFVAKGGGRYSADHYLGLEL